MRGRFERGKAAETHGRRSETLAALFLACKFYRVIGRRVRTRAGELDLIVKSPSGLICFVEVKARGLENHAIEAVSIRQRQRIARAAELYLGARPGLRHKGVRFDAVLVTPRRWPVHLKDAWRPGS
ncbi:MAG TPA: YraN family protein [Micropepsaceae bacterium]|jgi:putative endonuclease|nr:YraN family protein [Micropepsaceae bacterium]